MSENPEEVTKVSKETEVTKVAKVTEESEVTKTSKNSDEPILKCDFEDCDFTTKFGSNLSRHKRRKNHSETETETRESIDSDDVSNKKVRIENHQDISTFKSVPKSTSISTKMILESDRNKSEQAQLEQDTADQSNSSVKIVRVTYPSPSK